MKTISRTAGRGPCSTVAGRGSHRLPTDELLSEGEEPEVIQRHLLDPQALSVKALL
jgi:hypothetical protein